MAFEKRARSMFAREQDDSQRSSARGATSASSSGDSDAPVILGVGPAYRPREGDVVGDVSRCQPFDGKVGRHRGTSAHVAPGSVGEPPATSVISFDSMFGGRAGMPGARKVVWAAEGKSAATVDRFFKDLGPERMARLRTVTMDMSGAYIEAVKRGALEAQIVRDPYSNFRNGMWVPMEAVV